LVASVHCAETYAWWPGFSDARLVAPGLYHIEGEGEFPDEIPQDARVGGGSVAQSTVSAFARKRVGAIAEGLGARPDVTEPVDKTIAWIDDPENRPEGRRFAVRRVSQTASESSVASSAPLTLYTTPGEFVCPPGQWPIYVGDVDPDGKPTGKVRLCGFSGQFPGFFSQKSPVEPAVEWLPTADDDPVSGSSRWLKDRIDFGPGLGPDVMGRPGDVSPPDLNPNRFAPGGVVLYDHDFGTPRDGDYATSAIQFESCEAVERQGLRLEVSQWLEVGKSYVLRVAETDLVEFWVCGRGYVGFGAWRVWRGEPVAVQSRSSFIAHVCDDQTRIAVWRGVRPRGQRYAGQRDTHGPAVASFDGARRLRGRPETSNSFSLRMHGGSRPYRLDWLRCSEVCRVRFTQAAGCVVGFGSVELGGDDLAVVLSKDAMFSVVKVHGRKPVCVDFRVEELKFEG